MQTMWCKTEAGRNEIQQRTRKLPSVLRSILLLVDGQRNDDELRAMMSGLHAPEDALQQLAADGLIERRSGAAWMLAAVSAPSTLAVELADEAGMTLVGFLRGPTMNVYAGVERVTV